MRLITLKDCTTTNTYINVHIFNINMYLEHATKMAVPRDLFSIYDNLGIQIQSFVQDDFRCVFTFDRLECSLHTDLIITMLRQDTQLSEKEIQRKGLQLLHLDYFYDYATRFGFKVVRNGGVETFVLFKNRQLFAFEQAAQLWNCQPRFAPHGDILKILSIWDKNRSNTETLLIHLLFAEIPPAFLTGNFYNDTVVSLFKTIKIKEYHTYKLMKALWSDFLRILFTF